jgi:peptide/nickel transport system permease protein
MRILRRIGWAIIVVWFVVTATFAMLVAIPTDPARVMLGPHASDEALEKVHEDPCFDREFFSAYGCYLGHFAHGDLGRSLRSKRPVADIIVDRMWPTLQLALAALAIQLAIGVPLGVIAAVRRGRWPDRAIGVMAMLGQSAPAFVVGTLVVYVFGFLLGWFPIAGYGDGLVDRLWHLVLPATTLATLGVAYYSRVTRAEMLDVLGEDYIRTARAKGLAEGQVVTRHALRNAMGPIATLVGLDLGTLLGGAVVTEIIFAWPGIGRESVQAIFENDIPLIAGVVIVSALAVVLANLLADVLNLWLDPRLR